jgi:predicted CXXCH cytochrome family protein
MTNQKIFHLISVIIIFLLLAKMGGYCQDNNKPSCITAKCHANIGKAKFVHGPAAVGECVTCHQLVKDEKHKFLPIQNSEETCNKCHEPMQKKGTIHAPVAKGECTKCHDPHQSDRQFQLKKSSTSNLCFSCHPKNLTTKKFTHGPAAEGECLSCHFPHMSEKPKLLSKATNDLCFQCHTDFQETFAAAKNIHKPARENCVQCHNPHSADAKYLLASNTPDQCYTCHATIQTSAAKSAVKHIALDGEKKCLACHSPHTADHIKQLTEEPMLLCLKCHDKSLAEKGNKLSDMKILFDKNINWHGPIRERDCSGCHEVHGSQNFRLLTQTYPQEFYTSFANEKYELCFSCHQNTLTQDPSTMTLTGFRDGNRNLHYLHVNKKVKGRTCRACHETHASNHDRHIREAVPFGQWMLPIKFEKELSGGKCSPGCHAPASYKRNKNETRIEKTDEE